MKKITPEERDKLVLKPAGRSSYLRTVLMNLKVGEIIQLEPKDFKGKIQNAPRFSEAIA